MVLLAAVLGSYGSGCQSLRLATLSFNARNASEIAHLLRPGPGERLGGVTLLCSAFFRDHNPEEFAAARREAARFPGRWRIAAARSHAKVVCADFGPRKLVIEGSANLRTNGNWEQLTAVLDGELHDWHAGWIDALVSKHEQDRRNAEAGEGA
jgi:hypothetical protein